MNNALNEKLPQTAKTIWRTYSAIQILIEIVVYIGLLFAFRNMEIPFYIKAIVGVVLTVYSVVLIVFVPSIRWKIVSYEVREDEIELQTGLFIVKRTIIPIIRVQHVDVTQGPLIRSKKLANIDITTAATTHTIPLLNELEADNLRLKISELARVAKEDV